MIHTRSITIIYQYFSVVKKMRIGLGGVGIKAYMVVHWSWRTMGNDPSASEQYFKLQFLFLLLILKERISAFFLSLCSQKLMFLIPYWGEWESQFYIFSTHNPSPFLWENKFVDVMCYCRTSVHLFLMNEERDFNYLFVIIVCNHNPVFVNLALYRNFLTAL